MLHRNWLFMSAAGLAAFTAAACSSDEGTPGAGGSAGSAGGASDGAAGGAGTAQGDASQEAGSDAAKEASAAGDAEAGTPPGFVRVANLSPDLAAIDICVRRRVVVADAGTESGSLDAADAASDVTDSASADATDASDGGAAGFVGPLLKGAGIPTGLAYSQVTSYLPIAAPALYDVRVVAPNSDCATPLAGTTDSLDVLAVASASYSTFAAIGLTTPQTVPAFQVKGYADEHTVAAGQSKLRFIHASPGTANIDLGLGTAEGFLLLFGNVAYAAVGTPAGADAGVSGYLQGPPVTSQTLVARLTGDPTDVLLVSGFTLPADSITSVFAIGVVSSVTTPLKLLICRDLDTSKAPLSNCSVKP